jgi:hypothetical protein
MAGHLRSERSVGDACDHAVTESFFATLECELLDRTTSPPAPSQPVSTSCRRAATMSAY